jgi:tetratricopeptide (TPR) repeat protein
MPGPDDVDSTLASLIEEAWRLLERYRERSERSYLDRAEPLLRRVLGTAAANPAARSNALAALAEVLVQRGRGGHGPSSLDDAVDLARSAAGLVAPGEPAWPATRAHLAWALCERYEATGRVSDLEEALRVARAAYEAMGDDEGYPERTAVLRNLALAHRQRYGRYGRLADLDEAVRLIRQAVPASTDVFDSWVNRSTLATCLAVRFAPVGDLADADEAARLYRELLAELPEQHVERVLARAGLVLVLWQRFFWHRRPEDLAEATAASREVLDALPAYPHLRSMLLANHAVVLLGHFLQDNSTAHLAEAARAARHAIEVSTADDPRLGVHRVNLANIVLMLARTERDPAGVAEAVETGREALATLSPGNPDRARALGVLAEATRIRGMITGDPADLDAAAGLWRSAVGSRVGPTEVRMAAALAWGRAAAQARDAKLAMEGYAAAVGLLPVLAWRGLDRSVQERRLTEAAGVGSDAAAWALTAGQPRRAVELLEQGRQVLWSQAVQTRGDLSALAAVAPDLAVLLDETRRALEAGAVGHLDLPGGPAGIRLDLLGGAALLGGLAGAVSGGVGGGPGPGADATDARRRLAERWESLVEEARRLPGFADFLSAPPFERLRGAASAGPVVLVNTTRWRGDALVVTATDVHPVALPWLDHDTAQRRAAALLAAQREAETSREGLARAHWRHTLVATLRWLWDAVAEPVCAALADLVPPAPGRPPRVWWCPTGPLTMLPLHAAGRYGASPGLAARRRPSVPARYVSSYTPSLGALLRARSRPAAVGPPSVFAVGLTQTPGQAPLPEVAEELRAISTHLRGVRLLTGRVATRAAVLDALGRHSWAHFACHAVQSVDRPSASALHLADGRLSVLDLATGPALTTARENGPELAYLSACRTAAGAEALPDEAIHLTAALQMVGYRHVIGSQWAVTDRVAARVAGDVYARLSAGTAEADGVAGADAAALALAAALDRVRRDHPDRPELWASLVHSGP